MGDLAFLVMLKNSAKIFHRLMLISMLKTPLQFFQATPVGRILNRFNKDIEAVETSVSGVFVLKTKRENLNTFKTLIVRFQLPIKEYLQQFYVLFQQSYLFQYKRHIF